MVYLKDVTTLRLDSNLCTACGRCMEVCPHEVFRRNGANVEIGNRDACMECGACMMNCPFGAVSVKKGVGCAAAVISGILHNRKPSCGCGDSGCGTAGCC